MADYSSFSDEELIRDSESSEKISELLSRYMKTVFSLAGKYTVQGADYEELVSDGMDALLTAIGCYDASRGTFSSFAFYCVANRMKNTLDKFRRRRAKIVEEDKLEEIADSSPSPEERYLLKEDAIEVGRRIRNDLTESERNCLMGVVMGYSYEEIAAALGMDRKSVDNAISRARKKLRQNMTR